MEKKENEGDGKMRSLKPPTTGEEGAGPPEGLPTSCGLTALTMMVLRRRSRGWVQRNEQRARGSSEARLGTADLRKGAISVITKVISYRPGVGKRARGLERIPRICE